MNSSHHGVRGADRLNLVLKVMARSSLFFVATVFVWLVFARERVSFIQLVLIILPYIFAWCFVSLLSIAINGFIFEALWRGNYGDARVYSFPNLAYVILYASVVLVIAYIQYEHHMLS